MATTTLRFTLALRKSQRYPGFRARVVGRKTRPGELLFPISMEIPDSLLNDRKPGTKIVFPEPPATTAKVES